MVVILSILGKNLRVFTNQNTTSFQIQPTHVKLPIVWVMFIVLD